VYSALGPVVFFSSIAAGKMPHARLQRHFGAVTCHVTQAIGVLFVIPGGLLIAAGTALQLGNWLGLTLAAIPLMAVGQLGVRWFKGAHRIAEDVVLLWYFIGTILALLAWILASGRGAELLSAAPWGVRGMLLVGCTSGAAANWLLYRAVGDAPNPGLAYSIYSGSGIATYLAALAGAWLAPAYFPQASGDAGKFSGIVLVVAGVLLIGGMWEYLMAMRRPRLPPPTEPARVL
jgi:multidrug transporter EmrE-like cation transporter